MTAFCEWEEAKGVSGLGGLARINAASVVQEN